MGIMRLTKNNILLVRELRKDDIPYSYFVCMKSNKVSDSRQFSNYDKFGRTTSTFYDKERLPKSVKDFMKSAACALEYEDVNFTTFVYR